MASKSDLVTQGSHRAEFLTGVFQVHIIITNEIFKIWFGNTVISTYFLILCLFSQKQTNKNVHDVLQCDIEANSDKLVPGMLFSMTEDYKLLFYRKLSF